MDEGVAVQTALGNGDSGHGRKEFGERAGMAGNVLRAIHPRHNPTQGTLNRLLKPFQLRLSLARLEGPGDPISRSLPHHEEVRQWRPSRSAISMTT